MPRHQAAGCIDEGERKDGGKHGERDPDPLPHCLSEVQPGQPRRQVGQQWTEPGRAGNQVAGGRDVVLIEAPGDFRRRVVLRESHLHCRHHALLVAPVRQVAYLGVEIPCPGHGPCAETELARLGPFSELCDLDLRLRKDPADRPGRAARRANGFDLAQAGNRFDGRQRRTVEDLLEPQRRLDADFLAQGIGHLAEVEHLHRPPDEGGRPALALERLRPGHGRRRRSERRVRLHYQCIRAVHAREELLHHLAWVRIVDGLELRSDPVVNCALRRPERLQVLEKSARGS